MIEVINKEDCCGCACCVSVCPVGCIDMVEDGEGFVYPHVDTVRCVGCGRCDEVCPFCNAKNHASAEKSPTSFAARSVDDVMRAQSSSGGVFSVLCQRVLYDGGVVFGVVMDKDCKGCKFACATSNNELARMRGSKYIQADARGVYERVKSALKTGRMVLFCGTPCQVNALCRFLGKNWTNLITVDFICHGVPSKALWSANINEVERQVAKRVTAVNFRSKKLGWARYGLDMATVKGDSIFEPLDKSPYLRLFLSDCCLRPSCYACRAKRERLADVTIADFWGIGRLVPEMDDDLGCSLVIIRTAIGGEVIEEAASKLDLCEVHYAEAVRFNPSEHFSVERPMSRDYFFQDLHSLDYKDLVNKYAHVSHMQKIKNMVKYSAVGGLLRRMRNVWWRANRKA